VNVIQQKQTCIDKPKDTITQNKQQKPGLVILYDI